MDKKRLKVSVKVLKVVKEQFSDTKNFIEYTIDEDCQEEKISVEKVIFLQV